MKVTIKDIARLAGVSTATVSKVVNGKDERITDATRQRVLRVIKEQHYVPNRVASSMVTKQTKTLGLVIPDIANPFWTTVARSVEDVWRRAGVMPRLLRVLAEADAFASLRITRREARDLAGAAAGGDHRRFPGFTARIGPGRRSGTGAVTDQG